MIRFSRSNTNIGDAAQARPDASAGMQPAQHADRGSSLPPLRDFLNRLSAKIEEHQRSLFIGLILVHLVPIWSLTFFPSLDGPAHLSIADILVRYDDPDTEAFRHFFEINKQPVPNYFIFIILYALMHLFPPLTAEKVLLSVYVISLPIAFRYCVHAIRPQASIVAFLSFPILFHKLLHLGFYNYSFGVVFFLLAYGFWIRHSGDIRLRVVTSHFLLTLLLLQCHPSAFAISFAAIAVSAIGMYILERPYASLSSPFHNNIQGASLPRGIITTTIAYLPAIALLAMFTANTAPSLSPPGDTSISWPDSTRVIQLLLASSLSTYPPYELLASALFSVTLLLLSLISAGKEISDTARANSHFLVAVAFLILYLFAPDQFHVRWLPDRIMPYTLIFIALWLASLTPSSTRSAAKLFPLIILAGVLSTTSVGMVVRTAAYFRYNDYLHEYVSGADHMDPGATVLSLRISPHIDADGHQDSNGIFLQAAGYLTLMRSTIDLNNYQAASEKFPLQYRRELNPFLHLATDADFLALPPRVDLQQYVHNTNIQIDYLLLWGDDLLLDITAPGMQLLHQLEQQYDLIYVSAPRSLQRLYRRRTFPRPLPNTDSSP